MHEPEPTAPPVQWVAEAAGCFVAMATIFAFMFFGLFTAPAIWETLARLAANRPQEEVTLAVAVSVTGVLVIILAVIFRSGSTDETPGGGSDRARGPAGDRPGRQAMGTLASTAPPHTRE